VAAACRGYVLFSQNLRFPQWEGWASAARCWLGSSSAPGPDAIVPLLSSAFRPGRGCHQAGGDQHQRRRKARAGRDRKARLSKRMGVPCDQLPAVRPSPFSVTAAALWINAKGVWGPLRSRLPDIQAGQTARFSHAGGAGRSINQAGRAVPAARRKLFQWGSGPPEPLRVGSAIRDQCAPAWPGLFPMPITLWV